MLGRQSFIPKLLFILFTLPFTTCIVFERSALIIGSQTIDDGITVDAGITGGFLKFSLIEIEGDITNNGVLCVGGYGGDSNLNIDIFSPTLANNGVMLVGNWFNDFYFLKGDNFYNDGYFGMCTSTPTTDPQFAVEISFLTSFVNEGTMFLYNNDLNTTLQGPTSGIINNGLLEVMWMPGVLGPIIGTGCFEITEDAIDYIDFDLSKPFNQTVWINEGDTYPQIRFHGPPLPNNNVLLRGHKTLPWLLSVYSNDTITDLGLFTYTYNNLTGMLDYMAPGGTFTINIGTGFNETNFRMDGVNGPALEIPPPTIPQERPSNCPTDPKGGLKGLESNSYSCLNVARIQ